MKNLKALSFLLLLLMATFGVRAQNGNGGQNGNVVVSHIDLEVWAMEPA